MGQTVLETRKITKTFGSFCANDSIDFDLKLGEIHAIAGENGAGKSTLMKMLYGVLPVTSGDLLVDGEIQENWKSSIARSKGIGMVFQDFRLVPAFTVMENIFISLSEDGFIIKRRDLRRRIREVSETYNLDVDPDTEVWRLDLGQRQHVEIIKILLQEHMRIMIFDEPTSVLAPHEISSFLNMLSTFRDNGYAVILITHKLQEIISVADRITVLAHGRKTHTFSKEDGFSQEEIIREMLGQDIELTLTKTVVSQDILDGRRTVSLEDLTVTDNHQRDILKDVSFSIRPGEIMGIAGISGNGQRELAETLYGIRRPRSGKILFGEQDVTHVPIRERIDLGFRIVTEDPIRDSIVPSFSVIENMALGGIDTPTRHGNIDWESFRGYLGVRPEIQRIKVPELERITGTLSGGNLQRVSFVRATISDPEFLIACYPGRGLDVATVNAVHQILMNLREKGIAILVISEDLSELFEISDRITVVAGHRSFGPFDVSDVNVNSIGRLMLKGDMDDAE